jgi:hypothetical protein
MPRSSYLCFRSTQARPRTSVRRSSERRPNERFLPPRCAQTPAITGLQSRKAEFRDRRGEIIAAGFRILKKSRGHDGAHGVAADVLTAGVAASVAKETCHRAHGADFESIAQHAPGLVAPAAALTDTRRPSFRAARMTRMTHYNTPTTAPVSAGEHSRVDSTEAIPDGRTCFRALMNHVNLTSPRPPTSKSPARDRVRGA